MSTRDSRAYLADMLQACEDIQAMVAGFPLEQFTADRMRLKAVIRDLEVLGEAAGKLPAELRLLAPGIPWSRITGMRHRLIHGYFGVDAAIVFKTAIEDVPALLPPLRDLMAEAQRRAQVEG
jgi:uncharacterized protein with HEPN domain